MPQIMRVSVDMVADTYSEEEVKKLSQLFTQFAEGVAAEVVLDNTQHGKPHVTLHVHESTGDYACSSCRDLSRDRRSGDAL